MERHARSRIDDRGTGRPHAAGSLSTIADTHGSAHSDKVFNYFSLFASATLIQAAPPAEAGQQEPYVVMWVAARPESCNLALATSISLQALVSEPQRWEGECVAVDGYWQDRALFAVARDARRRYAQVNDRLRGRRVGIYGTKELLASAPRSPVAYTALGIAGQCDTLAEGAMMVMGYCHYTGGPYIAVAEMRRR